MLVPMPVCDTLLRLAEHGYYVPRWSEDILCEVARTLRRLERSEGQVKRRLDTMQRAFEDAIVTGYSSLESALEVEQKDRHVLAAAIIVAPRQS